MSKNKKKKSASLKQSFDNAAQNADKNPLQKLGQKPELSKHTPRELFSIAIQDADAKSVRYHLQHNPNISDLLENALIYVAGRGDTEIVDTLIEHGTELHLIENGDLTIINAALNDAFKQGHIKTAELLLKNGADPRHIQVDAYTQAEEKYGTEKVEAFLNHHEAKQKALKEDSSFPNKPSQYRNFLECDSYGNTLAEKLCAYGYIKDLFDMKIWDGHMDEVKDLWQNHIPAIYKKDFDFKHAFKKQLDLQKLRAHKTALPKRRPKR